MRSMCAETETWALDCSDPKLLEFLRVMDRRSTAIWSNEAALLEPALQGQPAPAHREAASGRELGEEDSEGDEEYQDLPTADEAKGRKKRKTADVAKGRKENKRGKDKEPLRGSKCKAGDGEEEGSEDDGVWRGAKELEEKGKKKKKKKTEGKDGAEHLGVTKGRKTKKAVEAAGTKKQKVGGEEGMEENKKNEKKKKEKGIDAVKKREKGAAAADRSGDVRRDVGAGDQQGSFPDRCHFFLFSFFLGGGGHCFMRHPLGAQAHGYMAMWPFV